MDEEYIKMILALPEELFKDWKYKNGDSILEFYDQKWNVHCIGDREIEDNEIGTIQGWECEFYSDDGIPTRPLPNQEQLQEMSGLDWWTFYSAIVHKSDISYEKDESILCACLKQTMWILYGQKWNGEKWASLVSW